MWSSLRSNLTDVTGFCPLIPEYQNITQLFELVDYSQDSWFASPPWQRSLLRQLNKSQTNAYARMSIVFDRATGGDVTFESTSDNLDEQKLVWLLGNASLGAGSHSL